MVSMVSIPSCGISDAWLVFRDTGAAWEPVLEDALKGRFSLDPIGSDIREAHERPPNPATPGSRSPSSKRTRIWHWDGSQFRRDRLEDDAPDQTGPARLQHS